MLEEDKEKWGQERQFRKATSREYKMRDLMHEVKMFTYQKTTS